MNMPFSRPGAIDLSALKQPPPSGGAPAGGTPGAAGGYAVELNEQNVQGVLEQSMQAPVVLVVYSRSRLPQSVTLADDLDALATEFGGKFLLGRLDVDAAPSLAQALQIPSVPLVAVVVQGRLAPLLQDMPPREELRTILQQVLDQMAAQGMTGTHQPVGGPAPEPGDETEPETDPRYAPAEQAMMSGDAAGAILEYEKLLKENPGDAEAAVGLARAKLISRTAHADLNAAREAAASSPDDLDAQILVADLDLLGGHVDDAFNRLIDVIRRTEGDDRDTVRLHLIELFTVVGDDPRVLKARQNLASALF